MKIGGAMKQALAIVCTVIIGNLAGWAQTPTNIAPSADRVLSAACHYLAEAPFFGFRGEVWRDHVTESGQKVQFARSISMEVKRPNQLHMEMNSPHSGRGFWYDGKSLSVLDRQRNFFSVTEMPGDLDAMIDNATEQFGIDLPLIDLAVSDPYKNAIAKVQKGTYYGLAPVLGVNCHHLAFTQTNVDWQIWIEDGPQPLIRKFVITHKNEDGAPEFTGLITKWDLTQRISDSNFVFAPPRDAVKIQMVPENNKTTGTKGEKHVVRGQKTQ
jgi:hypothetical protein